jgi:hypothetical protein
MKHIRYALCLTLGLTVLAPTGYAAEATPLHRTPRLPSSGGSLPNVAFQRKPFRIVYSGDGAALLAGRGRISNHLTWTKWNAKEGRAWGADWHDNCKPDCATGTYFAYRANVHVYRPRYLAGYLLFTRMTVAYTGSRPPYPAYRHGSVTYKLHYDAQYESFFWS